MNIDDVLPLTIVREISTGDLGTVVSLHPEASDEAVYVVWHACGRKLWILAGDIEPVKVTDEL